MGKRRTKKSRNRNWGESGPPCEEQKERKVVIEPPTGDDCPIHGLNDELIAAGVFSTLPLPDKLRVERVCQRWNQLMRVSVWPRLAWIDVGDGGVAPVPKSNDRRRVKDRSYHDTGNYPPLSYTSRLSLVLNRCMGGSLMELDLDMSHLPLSHISTSGSPLMFFLTLMAVLTAAGTSPL